MITNVQIVMDMPKNIQGHSQLEGYLKKKLNAEKVIVKDLKLKKGELN